VFTKYIRYLFLGLTFLYGAWIVYQVYTAGLAVLSNRSWTSHGESGLILGLLLIVMIPISFVARLSGRVKGVTALAFVVYFAQTSLVQQRPSAAAALHPVLGLVDLLLAIWLARQAYEAVRPAVLQNP